MVLMVLVLLSIVRGVVGVVVVVVVVVNGEAPYVRVLGGSGSESWESRGREEWSLLVLLVRNGK